MLGNLIKVYNIAFRTFCNVLVLSGSFLECRLEGSRITEYLYSEFVVYRLRVSFNAF
jgi:hypothetical protein